MCVTCVGSGSPATLQEPRRGHVPAPLGTGVPPVPPEGGSGHDEAPGAGGPSGLSFPPSMKAGQSGADGRGPLHRPPSGRAVTLREVTRPSRSLAGPVAPVPTPEHPPWGRGRRPFDAGAPPALINGGRARVSQNKGPFTVTSGGRRRAAAPQRGAAPSRRPSGPSPSPPRPPRALFSLVSGRGALFSPNASQVL